MGNARRKAVTPYALSGLPCEGQGTAKDGLGERERESKWKVQLVRGDIHGAAVHQATGLLSQSRSENKLERDSVCRKRRSAKVVRSLFHFGHLLVTSSNATVVFSSLLPS